MQTFERYLEEKQIEEGLKEIGKKFSKMMADFHTAKNIDTDFDELKTMVRWVKQRDLPKDKIKALDRFLAGLENADFTSHKGRTKLGKLEKDFKPLLKSFGVSIKV